MLLKQKKKEEENTEGDTISSEGKELNCTVAEG